MAHDKGIPSSRDETISVPIADLLLPTLRAVLARLVPTDQDPGALELGAEGFIHERIAENPDLDVVYERGLMALQEQGFESLDHDSQDQILKTYDERYPEFMQVISAHAVEAVYTHPIALKMVGFEVTL